MNTIIVHGVSVVNSVLASLSRSSLVFNLRRLLFGTVFSTVALLSLMTLLPSHVQAADLKVMGMGLGSGTVTSDDTLINCGGDCDESYGSAASVTLTVSPDVGSTFAGWEGDCSGTSTTCTLTMSADRSVRANFDLSTAIPTLSSFTPTAIESYLTANPVVDSAARFVKALPSEYKQNWVLMSRSESLQTGTAEFPRLLLPSANAHFVFTLGLVAHSSYPGAHPNAIEYMQWDATEKNFRFHEIILDAIPAMGVVPARTRGVSVDDDKCSKCHSTQNVLNNSTFPGTTGLLPGSIKAKNKPNWDTYDSWGGMMPLNRDRIYQGSVEAASFRKLFNPWTWRGDDFIRSIMEQLELQPSGVPVAHEITRTNGGTYDGHINFSFDSSPPVLIEPVPTGSSASITTNYEFDGAAGTGPSTSVTRGGSFITLHHSNIPTSDEGRGVRFFDALGGLVSGAPNQQRIADELVSHRFATGSFPIDIRPIALAITKSGCLNINTGTDTVEGSSPLTIDLSFFDARNGMGINDLVADTRARAESMPRRKADLQKVNLDRTGDLYVSGTAVNGLIQEFGAATSAGTDTSPERVRQEVFRRPIDVGSPDATVMGGIYVDRELYSYNTNRIALYRYFLEPLGISVDSWSMGVRGRSRTYSFADVFSTYLNVFQPELEASLTSDPVPGLAAPFSCTDLITAINGTLGSLPPADAVPTYTDVQRIFNRSCIECHGGLDYPPYSNYGSYLDLSEDENPPASTPPAVSPRLARSHARAVAYTTTDPTTSLLYQRIIDTSEDCPFGLMPCGGPSLSKVDTETIRRWIVGGRPSTSGDPHITTIDGVRYDFQAAGEFILLRGENFELQARHTPIETNSPLGPNSHTGLTSCVSVNSAVALRVGAHRITYQPHLSGQPDPNGLQLRVDGELKSIDGRGIDLASGGRIIQTSTSGGIQVEAPGGTVITITPGWWNSQQLWYMNINTRYVRATQGIMGSIAPNNWLPALPDGTFLGPRPKHLSQRYRDLYRVFGDSWRVTDTNTLFDYAMGTSTADFTHAVWPNGESPQSCRLPQTGPTPNPGPAQGLPLAQAEKHCADIIVPGRRENCVQDVLVTGEPGFAQTYLAAERLALNNMPEVPVLVSPEDHGAELVKPLEFIWNKTKDADGDLLTYRYCVWPVTEGFNSNNCIEVAKEGASQEGGNVYLLLFALLVCLVMALLVFVFARDKLVLLILLIIAIVILVTALLAENSGKGAQTLSASASQLEAGKAYYWKVIVEDNQGGRVESETRRFELN